MDILILAVLTITIVVFIFLAGINIFYENYIVVVACLIVGFVNFYFIFKKLELMMHFSNGT